MHVGRDGAASHNSPMASYKDEGLAYLRQVIEQTDKTATELARLAGVNQTTFTRPLNSSDHKYAVKFQALQTLSDKTGIPLPASLVAARSTAKPASEEVLLPIRYEVAAGGFLERDDLPQRPYGYRRVSSIQPYAAFPQWLERSVSDSMDKLIPVSSILHVVDAIAIEYQPTHNDIVIVERTRAQGALVERTVKQVAMTKKGIELWPRSHNPAHNKPISLLAGAEDAHEVTVQIAALVLRSYMFFTADEGDPE